MFSPRRAAGGAAQTTGNRRPGDRSGAGERTLAQLGVNEKTNEKKTNEKKTNEKTVKRRQTAIGGFVPKRSGSPPECVNTRVREHPSARTSECVNTRVREHTENRRERPRTALPHAAGATAKHRFGDRSGNGGGISRVGALSQDSCRPGQCRRMRGRWTASPRTPRESSRRTDDQPGITRGGERRHSRSRGNLAEAGSPGRTPRPMIEDSRWFRPRPTRADNCQPPAPPAATTRQSRASLRSLGARAAASTPNGQQPRATGRTRRPFLEYSRSLNTAAR